MGSIQPRIRPTVTLLLAGIAAACGTSGSGGTDPGENPAIAISISKTSMTIQQGGSDNLVATISRSGGFTGAVTITTEGAPAGVTGAASNVTTNGGTTTGTVTVSVAGTVAPGTYNLTIRATGSGVDAKTVSLALTVTPAPAIGVSLSAGATSAAQGEAASITVTIARTNYTGPVDLVLEGAPTGVTGTFTPAAATGTTSTLAIDVAGTAEVGEYELTVRGTGSGGLVATALFDLTVTALPTSYTLDVTDAVSAAQGGSAQATVTLTRTNFAAAVTLTLEGAPAGVTPTFEPPAPTGTTSILTLQVDASVAPGDYHLTVRGQAQGLADQTSGLVLTVTAVTQGNYTLTTTPAGPVTVQQDGGNVTVTVTILRTGGFAGSVTLAVSGAPAGLTADLNPTATPGNTSILTLSATAAVTPGNLQLTITGTATGLADQTVNLGVTVTGAPSGGSITLDYSGCLPEVKPVWLALQDGTGGAWTRIAGAGDVYSFDVTQAKAGIAVVTAPSGVPTVVTVSYYSQAEVTALGGGLVCPAPPATKQLTATTANLGATQIASIAIGGGSGAASLAMPVATVDGVASGTYDLTAYAYTPGVAGSGDRLIIRRDINTAAIAAGGSVGATLDFTGSESMSPASAAITLANGVGGESIIHGMTYHTGSSCETGLLYGGVLAGAPGSFAAYGVPGAQQRASDYHGLSITALSTGSVFRSVIEWFQVLAPRTVTLPSLVPAFTPASLGGPYKRLRFQFTQPVELNLTTAVGYSDPGAGHTVTMSASAGYLGGSAVDLAMPDFSAVAGWDNAWAPASAASVEWNAAGTGSTGTLCAGGRTVTSARIGTA